MHEEAATTLAAAKSPANVKKSEQVKIADAFSHSVPYDRQSKRWKEVTVAVTFCIAKDVLPLHTVEKVGFKRMVQKMVQRYR